MDEKALLDYQLRRLANMRRILTQADDVARSLLAEEPNDHDWRLLQANTAGVLTQIAAFERKREQVRP